MLVGDGSNGKSTYLKLLRTILGKENITSISIQDLCSSRFALAELYGKLANIYPDLEKRALKDTGIFKIATGEDFVSADRKFKGRINFENYAKLFFSANELPLVSDMTYAFWRRWIVIQFPNKFQQIDNFFEKTFTKEEIEGVILVSLFAFRNVLLRKKFSFEESEVDYKEVWLRSSDSVYAFIQDSIENKILKREEGAKEKLLMFINYILNIAKEKIEKRLRKQHLQKEWRCMVFQKLILKQQDIIKT
jgi:Predicted ATPase